MVEVSQTVDSVLSGLLAAAFDSQSFVSGSYHTADDS